MIAAEDCALRSLDNCKMAEGSSKQENDGNLKDAEEDEEDAEEDDSDANNGFNLYAKGEYNRNREKNIAELKLIVADLKKQHPIPTDGAPKAAVKKPATKKKSDDGKPVEKRMSMRNKGNHDNIDKRYCKSTEARDFFSLMFKFL
jgi:hypothetical protein